MALKFWRTTDGTHQFGRVGSGEWAGRAEIPFLLTWRISDVNQNRRGHTITPEAVQTVIWKSVDNLSTRGRIFFAIGVRAARIIIEKD